MINLCVIGGRLTKDIEVKYTTGGTVVVENSIAAPSSQKDENNKYKTEFVNFVMFGENANRLNKYSSKGKRIEIVGEFRTDTWDKQDGTKGYKSYIYVKTFQIIDFRDEREPANDFKTTQNKVEETEKDPFAEFKTSDDIKDDDLPF